MSTTTTLLFLFPCKRTYALHRRGFVIHTLAYITHKWYALNRVCGCGWYFCCWKININSTRTHTNVCTAISINWIHRRQFDELTRKKGKSLIKIRFPAYSHCMFKTKLILNLKQFELNYFSRNCANWSVENFNWKLNVNKYRRYLCTLYTIHIRVHCLRCVNEIWIWLALLADEMHLIYMISSQSLHILPQYAREFLHTRSLSLHAKLKLETYVLGEYISGDTYLQVICIQSMLVLMLSSLFR